LWKKKLYSKDPHAGLEAFKLLNRYLVGKPVQPVVGEELASSIKIDISAIPKHREPVWTSRKLTAQLLVNI